MNTFLPFAEKMLSEHSEFFPYAAGMKADGEIVSIAGYDGHEQPPAQEIIDLLNAKLRRDAALGLYKAMTVALDRRDPRPGRGHHPGGAAGACLSRSGDDR